MVARNISVAMKSLEYELNLPSIQQCIKIHEIDKEVLLVRDDLIHPVISGNKWRKLKYHLDYFFRNNYEGISSMGGVYSNHLHALAYCCHLLRIPCKIYLYGWDGDSINATLEDCRNWNAELLPITRRQSSAYRSGPPIEVIGPDANWYWIPEGGGGILGMRGMKELVAELPGDLDKHENLILCACGSGTTVGALLEQTTSCILATQGVVRTAQYDWQLHPRIRWMPLTIKSAFSGKSSEMNDFIKCFFNAYHIPLDQVYTGPLWHSFIHSGIWKKFNSICFIHTGGLQGNRSAGLPGDMNSLA